MKSEHCVPWSKRCSRRRVARKVSDPAPPKVLRQTTPETWKIQRRYGGTGLSNTGGGCWLMPEGFCPQTPRPKISSKKSSSNSGARIPPIPLSSPSHITSCARGRSTPAGLRVRGNAGRRGWRSQQESSTDPVFASDKPIISEKINRSLAQLEPKFREVVMLKLWGELTFDKIGEILDVSRSTAASRYRLALKKLLPLLAGIDHD